MKEQVLKYLTISLEGPLFRRTKNNTGFFPDENSALPSVRKKPQQL